MSGSSQNFSYSQPSWRQKRIDEFYPPKQNESFDNLPEPSEEQNIIIEKCSEKYNNNIVLNSLPGTGKSVLALAIAQRNKTK